MGRPCFRRGEPACSPSPLGRHLQICPHALADGEEEPPCVPAVGPHREGPWLRPPFHAGSACSPSPLIAPPQTPRSAPTGMNRPARPGPATRGSRRGTNLRVRPSRRRAAHRHAISDTLVAGLARPGAPPRSRCFRRSRGWREPSARHWPPGGGREGDLDAVRVVTWEHLSGAPFLGPVFCFKTCDVRPSLFLQQASSRRFGGLGLNRSIRLAAANRPASVGGRTCVFALSPRQTDTQVCSPLPYRGTALLP